jgi:polyisoprenoid-binding protein YceI
MKKITIIAAGLFLSATTFAQVWQVDNAHAKLGFTATHLMVNDVDGMFKTFDATITSSRPDFSDAVFNITAQASSIFTDNDKRDAHLRSADFFDADKNPTVTFKSTLVKKDGDKKLKITGDLTMHGITKRVVLDASFRGPMTHPMTKKPDVGFKVTGKVKRSDFKLGDSMPDAMISEEITITANGEFQQG